MKVNGLLSQFFICLITATVLSLNTSCTQIDDISCGDAVYPCEEASADDPALPESNPDSTGIIIDDTVILQSSPDTTGIIIDDTVIM